MTLVIFLDAEPLGLLSHPDKNVPITNWAVARLEHGDSIVIPAIIDYELRRELIRAGKLRGRVILNSLQAIFQFLSVSDEAFRTASEFWATSRRHGRPTAPQDDIDIDMILAAQAVEFARTDEREVIVATSNVRLLGLFVPAARWQDII